MSLYQETPLDEHRYLTDAVYHANRELVRALVEAEVLVPVEPCEHGNTGRHIIEGTIVDAWMTGNGPSEKAGFSYQMCDGIGEKP